MKKIYKRRAQWLINVKREIYGIKIFTIEKNVCTFIH